MRPPNLHSVGPDDGPPEILDEHKAWHLTLRTVAAEIALIAFTDIDLYPITHLMQLREMDAMGNLGAVTAGSVATGSFTLAVFFDQGSRRLKQQMSIGSSRNFVSGRPAACCVMFWRLLLDEVNRGTLLEDLARLLSARGLGKHL